MQKIEITGNQKIDREAILEKIGSAPGQDLSEEQVRKDIGAIHKLGYFDDIQADFSNGTLTYAVKERPAIYRIIFFGNDQISTSDLQGALTLKTYDIYDENMVRDSVRKLTKFYEDKGYYLAKVDYSVRPSKEKDMVELLFRVREYDKVKIRKISFLGNNSFGDDQLKRLLRNTSEGGFFSWATSSGNFKELDFRNDLQMLQYWYLNEGYVRFRHEPPIVTVSEDKKWVYITIKVEEGKQYRMGGIDFGGDLLFPQEELHNTLTLKEGETFSISKRNADILALTEKYQDLGYATVNVIPDIQFDDEKLLVTTNYQFEKGTLVRFGRVIVKGNAKTRDKVIRRELKIREGELYSGSGMRISKENVERLGFFEEGSVQFQTKSPENRPDIMDVEISLKERPTGQFQVGAGYASTTKFFFTAQVSESNFRGKGQDLRFQTQLSRDKNNRTFTLSFTDPYAWDSLWSMGGSLSYALQHLEGSYTEFRRGFGLNLGHPVGDYTRLFLGYRLESLRLLNVEDLLLKEVLSKPNREEGSISSVSITMENDKRNNRLETTDGHLISVSEEFAGLGGNRTFLRTVADVRYFKKIWGDLTFRNRLKGGNLWDYSGNETQSAELWRLGGPNDLRGFASFDVGPKKEFQGRQITQGGRNHFLYMAELEYPIAKEIGLKFALFYDTGSVFNELKYVTVRQDWGFGLRWFSPLGPLRFEWGYPLGKDKGKNSQFYFMIGPPF